MNFVDFGKVKRFKPEEFPEDPVKHAAPGLIYSLDDFAIQLKELVYPSPAPGALARFDGSKTSRHYAVNRSSDGCDVFCGCPIFKAWSTALHSGLFHGVGVYFDTHYKGRPWPMLHLDKRPERLLWFRDSNGKYRYPHHEDFWEELSLLLSFTTT